MLKRKSARNARKTPEEKVAAISSKKSKSSKTVDENEATKSNLLTWKFTDLRALAMLQGTHDDAKCSTMTPNQLIDLIMKDANDETWKHAQSPNLASISKILEQVEDSTSKPPPAPRYPAPVIEIEEEAKLIPEPGSNQDTAAAAVAAFQAISKAFSNGALQSHGQGNQLQIATDEDKRTTEFTAKYNLKKTFVEKIAANLYVSIQDARVNSALANSIISEKGEGTGVHISSAKRNKIPGDFAEYSQLLSIIMEARLLFQVPGRSADVEFLNFMRDYSYKFLTPIGSFSVDEAVRSQNDSWWPPSPKTLLRITFLISMHKKSDATTCYVCGALEHAGEFCSSAALIFAKPFSFNKPTPPIVHHQNPFKPVSERELCRHFMNKKGACTRSNCTFNHKCSACGWIKKHNSTCNRK